MMLLFYNAKLWLGNHTKTTDLNEMHKFLAKLCSYKEAKKKKKYQMHKVTVYSLCVIFLKLLPMLYEEKKKN